MLEIAGLALQLVVKGWRFIVGGMLVAIILWPIAHKAGEFAGGRAAKAQCKAESLAAQLAEQQRQTSARSVVIAAQRERLAELDRDNSQLETQNADYAKELAAARAGKPDACNDDRLSESDRDRLFRSWGLRSGTGGSGN